MEQVDFYVLEQGDISARHHFVCRLAEKILSRQLQLEILVEDNEHARLFDQFMWETPPESFVPHSTPTADDSTLDPVVIRNSDQMAYLDRVCINLRPSTPSNHDQLKRLVEVVCQDPAVLQSTRQKYGFYRQQGYPLQSHPIANPVN